MVDNREKVQEVVRRILEESAFIFADPLKPEERPDIGNWRPLGVSLDFSGETSGTLHLWAEEGFAYYAAANMLGMDENSPEAAAKGTDALKEILNMTAGNVLTGIYGEKPVFNLGIPRTSDAGLLAEDYAGNTGIWLEAEGYELLFILRTNEG
jgi:hypothetical protein